MNYILGRVDYHLQAVFDYQCAHGRRTVESPRYPLTVITSAPVDDVLRRTRPVQLVDEFAYEVWCIPLGLVRVRLDVSDTQLIARDTIEISGSIRNMSRCRLRRIHLQLVQLVTFVAQVKMRAADDPNYVPPAEADRTPMDKRHRSVIVSCALPDIASKTELTINAMKVGDCCSVYIATQLRLGHLHPTFDNRHLRIEYVLRLSASVGVCCDVPIRVGSHRLSNCQPCVEVAKVQNGGMVPTHSMVEMYRQKSSVAAKLSVGVHCYTLTTAGHSKRRHSAARVHAQCDADVETGVHGGHVDRRRHDQRVVQRRLYAVAARVEDGLRRHLAHQHGDRLRRRRRQSLGGHVHGHRRRGTHRRHRYDSRGGRRE